MRVGDFWVPTLLSIWLLDTYRPYSFWRTIPTFNLYIHSAEHGQDFTAQAQEFITAGRKAKSKEKEKEQREESNEDDAIEVQSGNNTHLADDMPVNPLPSPVVPPCLFGNTSIVSVASRSVGPQSQSVSQSVSRGRTSLRGKLRGLKTYGTFTGSSSSPVVDDDDGMATLSAITGKHIDRKIAEQSAKRARYENLSARINAEVEKERLKQQERLIQLQYEHEQERENYEQEKEAHELRLMQMQYALRNPGQPGLGAWSPEPYQPSMQIDLFGTGQSNAGPSMQHDLFGVRCDTGTRGYGYGVTFLYPRKNRTRNHGFTGVTCHQSHDLFSPNHH